MIASPQSEQVCYMENLCQGFVGVRKGHFKLVISEYSLDSNKKPHTVNRKLSRSIQFDLKNTRKFMSAGRERKKARQTLASWWRTKG